MHPAPVATHDSTLIELPWWATGGEAPDDTLDLAVYPEQDELIEAEGFRAIERVSTNAALILAAALVGYMLIGILIAHHAGRI